MTKTYTFEDAFYILNLLIENRICEDALIAAYCKRDELKENNVPYKHPTYVAHEQKLFSLEQVADNYRAATIQEISKLSDTEIGGLATTEASIMLAPEYGNVRSAFINTANTQQRQAYEDILGEKLKSEKIRKVINLIIDYKKGINVYSRLFILTDPHYADYVYTRLNSLNEQHKIAITEMLNLINQCEPPQRQ